MTRKWKPPRYLPITKSLNFKVNPDIPQTFYEEFVEDDPRTKGITIHMNATDRFQLYYAARVLTLPVIPITYVDIGTYEGGSALLIYNALVRSSRQFCGWTMDPRLHPNLDVAKTMFGDKVIYLQSSSGRAANIIELKLKENKLYSKPDKLDFVFVDGRHDRKFPYEDAMTYFSLLRAGGLMLFHDYFPPFVLDGPHDPLWDHYTVYDACTELEKQLPIRILDIPFLSSSWKDPIGYGIPKVYSAIRAWRKII